MGDLRIKEWLERGAGYGAGNGYGYGASSDAGYGYGSSAGYGAGNGYGDGSGNGNGYGDGYGAGYGYGASDGYGDGAGYGAGNGYGDGTGYGYGDGYGNGADYGYGYKINGDYIHRIDGVATIIKSIKGNLAKGYIVNKDLTKTKTYITKSDCSNYFAHGKTAKDAFEQVQQKVLANLDVDVRIEEFLKEVDAEKEYPTEYFFNWHGVLTGSCRQGREAFCKNKNINMSDKMTLKEFVEISKDEYGGDVIRRLKCASTVDLEKEILKNCNGKCWLI